MLSRAEPGCAFTMRFFKQPELFTYESLFTWIQKNTILRKKIENILPNSKELGSLLQAIYQADFNDQIFDNPDCDIFLLRLFKDKKISSTIFISIYNYLLVLMEYGNQPLRPEDNAKYKFILNKKPRLLPLFINDKINPVAAKIINEIIDYNSGYESIFRNFDPEEFYKELKRFPPAETAIIAINIENSTFNVGEKLGSTPIYGTFIDDTFYQLNVTIMVYLNQKIFNSPMTLYPAFGRIGGETLRRLHLNNFHFYPLYNKYVKNNFLSAHHENVIGPFSVAQHDAFHFYIGSFLSESARKYICGYLIELFLTYSNLPSQVLERLCFTDNSLNDLVPLVLHQHSILG